MDKNRNAEGWILTVCIAAFFSFILFLIIICNSGCSEKTTKVVLVSQCPEVCDKHKHPNCVMPPFPGLGKKIASGQVKKPAHSRMLRTPGRAAGTHKLLVLLVDFGDRPGGVTPSFYDSHVFGENFPAMKHFYLENSYGKFELATLDLPSSTGWIRAPYPASFYIDSSYGLAIGQFNATNLAADAVRAADSLVDFSQYDNDGNGIVDGIVIVHSGSGAELTGNPTDIWSHQWEMNYVSVDGVYARDYCMVPEYWLSGGDMTIGVYAHEFGHILGLPDLYGTEMFAGSGLGRWSLMSHGSWNGNLGSCPAHLDAWSKDVLGFAPTQLVRRTDEFTIEAAELFPSSYKLQPDRKRDEYWLVENRQQIGYDKFIPSSGLLIYHVDDRGNKRWESNKYGWWPESPFPDRWWHVAIEQADGRFDLDHCCTGYGDAGDPWPGLYNRRTFNRTSRPSSDFYLFDSSGVSVDNILDNGQTMTARLGVK